MQHLVALIDCNNFFASCESVFNPALKRKPVVVLSSNDGCVVSRSPEAKMLGIPMGVPYFQIRELCQKQHVHVCSSNFRLYGDMSRRVMTIIEEIATGMQQYSIDEAFCAVPSARAHSVAQLVRTQILQWTGITVSVGIGHTKTLAKLASEYAKRASDGILILDTPQEILTLRDTTPIEDVWGIGRQHAATMRRVGIATAQQFVDAPNRTIEGTLGVYGMRIKLELKGIPCRDTTPIDTARASITSSRSFGGPVQTCAHLSQATAHHVSCVAQKLRADGSATQALLLSFRHGTRREGTLSYTTDTVILPAPTNDSFALIRAALDVVEKKFRPGRLYRKVSVTAVCVVPESSVPVSTLWNDDAHVRYRGLMATMDAINHKFNKRLVMPLAALPVNNTVPWLPRQDNLSPEYTTKWSDLPLVHT
jgi:DNA polymerase V